MPLWASNARTTRLPTPMNVAQPLGEIEDLITMGVVRDDASSTAQ
jgi:hypothetical protein